MGRNVYLNLVSPEQAKKILLEKFPTGHLGAEKIPLAEAHGRILAEPSAAAVSSPAFHGAAMDGVAVIAEDTFGATERRPKILRIGENAHWINTGHPLPEDCNAVVMIEHVIPGQKNDSTQTIILEKAAFPWQHVRRLGEDIVATEIVLPPGIRIGPYQIGALAAAGITCPLVLKKPKVAIIPSGSELIPLEQATEDILRKGEKLPEFNSLILAAMVTEIGGDPLIRQLVPDQKDAIRDALLETLESGVDLIIINAGSSAGSKDYTAEIIAGMGEVFVHGISMMPGKPTIFGQIKNRPVIGLPGYPVSAVLAFEEFLQPLLASWLNTDTPFKSSGHAYFPQHIPSRPGMEEFVRVKLGLVDDKFIAVPLPRGAGTVSSLSRADGIVRIAANSEGISAGALTPVHFIRPAEKIAESLLAIGSHDNTLDLLDSFLRKNCPGHSLTSAHVGSLGGLIALKEGRCHLAGSHLLDNHGIYNKSAIQQHLADLPVHLLRLVDRVQGILVLPGNPLSIISLEDLARPGVRFINRQRGSGTRVLLDFRLKQLGVDATSIQGYEDEEFTHMQIAAAVLSGRADAGLGVQAAAVALGLDFIPIGVEEYDLVIPSRYWQDKRMQALINVIRSKSFKNAVNALGGYGVEKTGEVVWVYEG